MMEQVENFWAEMPEPREPKIVAECGYCGMEMYEGEHYYKIGEEYYCENCVETGELEDNEEEW